MSVLTAEDVRAIVADIAYKDWTFHTEARAGGFLLQVRFVADGEAWGGRKWYLSAHMTRSEVVQTALKAVLTAEEHEARERFLYGGVAVFGPYLDVDELRERVVGTVHRQAVSP